MSDETTTVGKQVPSASGGAARKRKVKVRYADGLSEKQFTDALSARIRAAPDKRVELAACEEEVRRRYDGSVSAMTIHTYCDKLRARARKEHAELRNSARYEGGLTTKEFEDQMCARIRAASDKRAELTACERAVYHRCNGVVKDSSIKKYCDNLRSRARKENPGLKPAGYIPEVSVISGTKHVADRQRATERFANPAQVDCMKLIDLAVDGVRDGIEHTQVPQVLFCLSFLVCLRSNDLNPQSTRVWSPSASPDFYKIAAETAGGVAVLGTLLNLLPSKLPEGLDPASVAYSTVFICHPSHYGLMAEALAFVFKHANLKCTSCATQYERHVPSGAQRDGEWGTEGVNAQMRSIMPAMIARLKLETAITSWGGLHKSFQRLGRSFVASCINSGIFALGAGLTPALAANLALGHGTNTGNDACYLKVACQPERYQGMVLCKVDEHNNFDNATLKSGIFLRKAHGADLLLPAPGPETSSSDLDSPTGSEVTFGPEREDPGGAAPIEDGLVGAFNEPAVSEPVAADLVTTTDLVAADLVAADIVSAEDLVAADIVSAEDLVAAAEDLVSAKDLVTADLVTADLASAGLVTAGLSTTTVAEEVAASELVAADPTAADLTIKVAEVGVLEPVTTDPTADLASAGLASADLASAGLVASEPAAEPDADFVPELVPANLVAPEPPVT